ncbi:MAG: thioredoxin family protein [bacterium]|nr:thioredoxin family protein [bacterium]
MTRRIFLTPFLSLAVVSFVLIGCAQQVSETPIDQPVVPPATTDDKISVPSEVSVPASLVASATYEAYSSARFAELKGKQPVALFFHASWCSTCRKMDGVFNSKLSELPAGSTILKVDYDTETELKKEFGVTTQSIVVFLNAKGEVVGKHSDPSLDKVKELLKP